MKPLLKQIHEARYKSPKGVMDTTLLVTPEMMRQARGNKMHIIAKISPEDFIKLTTSDLYTVKDINKQCHGVDDYNRWADEGETIIMPALWIREGSVVSHEGRHRAAALICAGAREMPISIRLFPDKEHQKKYGYWDAEYRMRSEDLPEAIHGQYDRGIVLKSDIKVVIDGWDNIK